MGWLIVTFLLAATGTLVLGLLLRWVDRKVTAMVQWRVGPPWYQPAVDILKLMGKETLVPTTARGAGFLLVPVIALASTAVAAAVLWQTVIAPQDTFIGDLIVVIYLLIIPAAMTILGASASGNPHAAVGASREIKLLMSYELPMLLALLVAIIRAGWTLQLGGIVAAQAEAPFLFSISGAIAIIVAVLCTQAKLGQVPFDLAEAECEIMSGVYVEYSGPLLACWLMTRAMLLAIMPLLLIIVFWGGFTTASLYSSSWWWGLLSFLGKYVLFVALVTLIRNTNPRLRIDQTLKFFWFGLTPIAVAAVILALVGISRGIPWL
ncbi:MAG: complex I subunit 1 family protein [Planctomycetota bacterium]|nr:complex I subunit 1 family protein [Planctomycetota bacterium]